MDKAALGFRAAFHHEFAPLATQARRRALGACRRDFKQLPLKGSDGADVLDNCSQGHM
jgi:hypothetical protein